MLTSDLLRVKVAKKEVTPRFIDPENPEALSVAGALCACFEAHLGKTRGELFEAIEDLIGFGTDFLVWRGLSKLLYDRSEFEVDSPIDPSLLRQTVFDLAQTMGPVTHDAIREQVYQAAATSLGIKGLDASRCAQVIYADLDARKPLISHKKIAPDALLHRYNLALAQAVLYQAVSLDITLEEEDPNLLRYLFQSLKFHRLMHRVWRESDTRWRLHVDGPVSLFSQSRKYGLQMSTFLPSLILMGAWELTATLAWKKTKTPHTMRLGSADGLVSHYRAKGQWISDEERMFESRFAKEVKKAKKAKKAGEETDFGWTLERRGTLIELGEGEVLIPDYVLGHEESGEKVFVEVVGFWRKAYLTRRLEHLERKQHVPLVLVVSQRLGAERKKVEQAHPFVVFYKGVIVLDDVLQAAEHARGVLQNLATR